MNEIAGHQIESQISSSLKTAVYSAIDVNGQPVTLKVLRKEFASPERIARFKREYEFLSTIDSQWVVKALKLVKHEQSLVMVLESFPGQNLKEYIRHHAPVKTKSQLRKSLEITRLIILALSDIHEKKIIHKDINPANIIYDSVNHQLKVIDFGLATDFSFERLGPPAQHFEGTYAYISPEQTGRFKRDVDYRSDYYSLGITLYELFGGQLPFFAQSVREWIHRHIAKEPAFLSDVHPEIPYVLSAVIRKLTRKAPSDRYQSSFGLLRDIDISLEAVDNPGILDGYHAGKFDRLQSFQVPDKLYGRMKEINELIQGFYDVRKGQPGCVIIKGYSGIGKTALVEEIKRPIISNNGIFISGKFDQLTTEVPYSALTQAFTNLINTIISESKEEIEHWKNKILTTIPGHTQLIIDVIPELELITGKQKAPPELPSSEAQQRFDVTFQKFFQLFAEEDQPLVIFLDDLHWADLTSLDMMQKILKSSENKPVMIIGAYRSNYTEDDHPLTTAIHRIYNSGILFKEIELQNLSSKDITRMLEETFSVANDEASETAQLCHTKTRGNPFFLVEFLSDLYRKKYMRFDMKKGRWSWNIEEIKRTEVTENVADILSQRIKDLPHESQEILTIASCFGTHFDLNTLSIVSEKSWPEVFAAIKAPLKESLILPMEEEYLQTELKRKVKISYRFLHDRVQQSAYELLDERQKAYTHLKIGRLLMARFSEDQVDDELFVLTGHFNKGMSFLRDDEKDFLIRFNLKACKKAKKSGAFDSAFHYSLSGIKLVSPKTWQENKELAFALYAEAAEAGALSGEHEKMEELLQTAFEFAFEKIEKASLHEIRTLSLVAQNRQQEAVRETLFLLNILGVKFPKKAGMHHVLFQLFRTRSRLKKLGLENISTLPQMKDPVILIAMRNMANVISVLYRTDPNLFSLLVFKMITLTLNYGVAPISPVSFITFGLLTHVIFGKIPRAYELGQMGMKLFERLKAEKHWAQAFYIYNVGVTVWKEPLDKVNDNLYKAYKVAQETGDFEYMMSASAARAHYLFRAGHELNELIQSTEEFKKTISHVYEKITSSQFDVLIQMFTNFVEYKEKPEELISEFYDEREMIRYHQEDNDETSLIMIYLDKLTLAYYYERYDAALEILKKSRKYIQGIAGLLMEANYKYFESLTLLAVYPSLSFGEKRKAGKKIKGNQKKMKKWADHAPMNFLCKYKLIEAERAKASNNYKKAGNLYEEAIALSHKNGFIHEEALANELAGKYWIHQKSRKLAKIYVNNAYQLYNLWGASGKAAHLKQKYSDLFTLVNADQEHSMASQSSSSTQFSLSIDIETVLEASKTISGEIVLNDLLRKILIIILEHAGAQKGVLILKDEQTREMNIEAMGEVAEESIKTTVSHRKLTNELVPVSVINYSERTNQQLILNHASEEGYFVRNEYIEKNSVKSLAVIPILQQAELLGILYLENNLTSNVFTEDRVNVLTILCTQAAVSIRNARLYYTLEKKVEERTEEVVNQKEELQQQAEVLQKTNEELEVINTTKDKLFSIIAHDLRNPFNIILGHSHLLREDLELLSMEDIKQSVEYIDVTSKNAYELLQNLLEWSRSQLGRIESKPALVQLDYLVERNLSIYGTIAESKEIEVVKKGTEGIEVFADQDMINTVLRNLISNALKFTEKGGRVEISAKRVNDEVEVSIEDNGVGISKENRTRLFRLDESYSTNGTADEKGTGLGLILVKDFIERNQGQLKVESELNKGTIFRLILPAGERKTGK